MDQQVIYDGKLPEKQIIDESLDISQIKGKDYYVGLINDILTMIDKIEKFNLEYQIRKKE